MKRAFHTAIIAPVVLTCCAAMAQQPTIPPVELSEQHAAICKVTVGDAIPTIELTQLGGTQTRLADLYGHLATVVLFWNGDKSMSQMALTDLQHDVVHDYGPQGVAVVGIAVNESAEIVGETMNKSEVRFPTLLDPEGQAFSQVGGKKLPRLYVLDPRGKILWFDIEYSLATRRELNQSLHALLDEDR
jgi:peroxiredoxin